MVDLVAQVFGWAKIMNENPDDIRTFCPRCHQKKLRLRFHLNWFFCYRCQHEGFFGRISEKFPELWAEYLKRRGNQFSFHSVQPPLPPNISDFWRFLSSILPSASKEARDWLVGSPWVFSLFPEAPNSLYSGEIEHLDLFLLHWYDEKEERLFPSGIQFRIQKKGRYREYWTWGRGFFIRERDKDAPLVIVEGVRDALRVWEKLPDVSVLALLTNIPYRAVVNFVLSRYRKRIVAPDKDLGFKMLQKWSRLFQTSLFLQYDEEDPADSSFFSISSLI